MSTTTVIDRLQLVWRPLAPELSDGARFRRLGESLAAGALGSALDAALVALPGAVREAGEEEVVCLRSVETPLLRVRTDEPDADVLAQLAEAIAGSVGAALAAGGSDEGTFVRYRSRAHAAADLLTSRRQGDLRREWAWRQLGLIAPDPASSPCRAPSPPRSPRRRGRCLRCSSRSPSPPPSPTSPPCSVRHSSTCSSAGRGHLREASCPPGTSSSVTLRRRPRASSTAPPGSSDAAGSAGCSSPARRSSRARSRRRAQRPSSQPSRLSPDRRASSPPASSPPPPCSRSAAPHRWRTRPAPPSSPARDRTAQRRASASSHGDRISTRPVPRGGWRPNPAATPTIPRPLPASGRGW